MAYQSVGTPRFYIDTIQYLKSVGFNFEQWYLDWNPRTAEGASVIDGSYSSNWRSVIQDPEIFDFNFGEQKKIQSTEGIHDKDWMYWWIPTGIAGWDIIESDNVGRYFMILNHTVRKDRQSSPTGAYSDGKMRWWGDYYGYEGGAWGTPGAHDYPGSYEVNIDYKVVMNGEWLSSSNIQEKNSGTTIAATQPGVFSALNPDRVSGKFARVGIGYLEGSEGLANTLYLGGISYGKYYDMPHSPDLKLTMETEFDGYDSITTLGGSTLTRTRYTGSPWWYDVDGNKIEPFGVIQEHEFSGIASEDWLVGNEPAPKRNGRRIWNLKFSYLKGSDLFAENPMAGTYLEDSTDIDYSDLDEDNLGGQTLPDWKFDTDTTGNLSGTITDADCSDTTITFTSTSHGLTAGLDRVVISGTTSFNDDKLRHIYVVGTATHIFTMERSSSSSATNETGTWATATADYTYGSGNPDPSTDENGISWHTFSYSDHWTGYNGTRIHSSVAEFGENLLKNPGFETAGAGDPDFWADWIEVAGSGALANTTTYEHSGSNAARLQTISSNKSKIYQNVSTKEDGLYRLSFWCRGDGTSQLRFNIEKASDGTDLSYYTPETGVKSSGFADVGNTEEEWVQKSVWFRSATSSEENGVAFGGANAVKISFQSGSSNGFSYVDDVRINSIGYYNGAYPADDALTAGIGENANYQFRQPLYSAIGNGDVFNEGVTYKIQIECSEYTSGLLYFLIQGSGSSYEHVATTPGWISGTGQWIYYIKISGGIVPSSGGNLSLYSTSGGSMGVNNIGDNSEFVGKINNVRVWAVNPQDFKKNINTDDSFQSVVLNRIGNGQKFIFQPNNTANNPGDFAICVLDQDSLKVQQVAHNTYNCAMKIKEVW